MKKYINNLNKTDKILYLIFCILTLLVLTISVITPNKHSFAAISVVANLFLIMVYREIKKLLNINFSKKEKLIISIIILLIYISFGINIYYRKFFYFFDYACYYNIQLSTAENFSVGLLNGIRAFVGSTWSGEYGNFLSFFPEIIFHFTDRTTNSFILSYIFIFTPYVITALSMFLKKISEKLNLKNSNLFFVLALISFILFPVYHATAVYGQPDFFGLAFVFLIILLTINYDFKEIDYVRLILIFMTTFMLIITRRWYIYWIISYFICYIVKIYLTNIKNKTDLIKITKHLLCYGIIVITLLTITLFPMIKNILKSSIGDYSAFYLTSGFKGEIVNQIRIIGYLPLLLMIIGILYSLNKKELRMVTILSIVQCFLIIFLFTRIQNMGHHHTLTLLPIYLYWFYLCLNLILSETKTMAKRYCILYSLIIIVNFIFSINNVSSDVYFTYIPLKVNNDKYYENYVEVANWLTENLNENNQGYLISHNTKFNPDKFRNINMPDKTIFNNMPYGSAVIGTHSFPTGLFTAKYVMTTTPFEYISIEYKFNDVFLKLVEDNKFKKIKEFDMGEGYKFIIYERIEKVDAYEIDLYQKALDEESKTYPHLYKDIIDQFEY